MMTVMMAMMPMGDDGDGCGWWGGWLEQRGWEAWHSRPRVETLALFSLTNRLYIMPRLTARMYQCLSSPLRLNTVQRYCQFV